MRSPGSETAAETAQQKPASDLPSKPTPHNPELVIAPPMCSCA